VFPPDSQLHFPCVPQDVPNNITLYPISFAQNFTLVINIARSKGNRDVIFHFVHSDRVLFGHGPIKEAGYQNKNARYQLGMVIGTFCLTGGHLAPLKVK
jgi:hypothetical protein